MPTSIYNTLISAQGFIPLPLPSWRLVVSNEVPIIAVASGNGGNLASDTSPKLIRVSTSTDKALSISWAASTSIEIFTQFYYPPDMDVTLPYTVNLRVKNGGATDVPTITVGLFEGIGDTTRGAATAATSGTLQTLSVSITPTGGHPNFAVVTLVPGAHTTDTVVMYEAYILYSRKLLAS